MLEEQLMVVMVMEMVMDMVTVMMMRLCHSCDGWPFNGFVVFLFCIYKIVNYMSFNQEMLMIELSMLRKAGREEGERSHLR